MSPARLTDHERALRAVTEKALEGRIRAIVKKLGGLYYHTYRSTRSPAGFPDDTIIVHERLLFAELKREGQQPSEAQVEWLDGLARSGVEVYLWMPRDWDSGEITRILSAWPATIDDVDAGSRWVPSWNRGVAISGRSR